MARNPDIINWQPPVNVDTRRYTCAFCGATAGPNKGYHSADDPKRIYILICTHCNRPTYFEHDVQTPGAPYGAAVANLPDAVGKLYDEIRNCMKVTAYTLAVLGCRTMLMHIAVEQGAKAGDSFKAYVEYLDQHHFIPPNGKAWVDFIRDKGNEANHQIVIMGEGDAKKLIKFVEHLLRIVYEFPNSI